MCRICGRMVKCMFENMPSRISSLPQRAVQQPFQRRSHHVSSRALISTALNVKASSSTTAQPPTFLLPFRSIQTATAQRSAASSHQFHATPSEIPPTSLQPSEPASSSITTSQPSSKFILPSAPTLSNPLVLSKSIQQYLPNLTAQHQHYIRAHIHRFPYILTTGDILRLPFVLHGASPGDILRLNRASMAGSRDYTLKAGTTRSETYDAKRTGEPSYLDERLFLCRVRVLGLETEPMRYKEKTKRRNRKVKTAKSKERYTVLRVMEARVRTMEEVMQEDGMVLLEGQGESDATIEAKVSS